MNDKIFELQQDLITLQDSFKNAIMSEPDAEKHISVISKASKDEEKLSEKIQKEIEELEIGEVSIQPKQPEILLNLDAKYFADKYNTTQIKAVARQIGVRSTGTELQVAGFILNKISAEEFTTFLK